MKKSVLLAAFAAILLPASASGFGLRTHLYIADQVYDDLLPDCAISAGGRSQRVPQDVCDAVRNKPAFFRAGAIGPDAFPDLIMGQSFVHPGTENGAQAADWLDHLLANAGTEEEIAFAYGYLVHAASDVFAHSYVNNYAGDVFVLTRMEQKDVEWRHTLLERYIDQRLDYDPRPDLLEVPGPFIVRTMVLPSYLPQRGSSWFRRRFSALPGLHLATMRTIIDRARREANAAPCAEAIATGEHIRAYQALVLAEHAALRAIGSGEAQAPAFGSVDALPRCESSDVASGRRALQAAAQLLNDSEQRGRPVRDAAAMAEGEDRWQSVPVQLRRAAETARTRFAAAAQARNRARALGVFIPAWANDLDAAADRYMTASLQMARQMVRSSAPIPPPAHERESAFTHHRRWFACYVSLLSGDPLAAGDARCDRMARMQSEMSPSEAARLTMIGDDLRTTLARYVAIRGWINDQIAALARGVGQLASPSAVGLYEALTDPRRLPRGELDRAFGRGRNGQLEFQCATDWIDADLGMLPRDDAGEALRQDAPCMMASGARLERSSAWLVPERFIALQHAITLSKLALLDADGVVGLARGIDAEAAADVRTGAYPRYSILLDTVRSLDGSYQWNSSQMPYPRRGDFDAGFTPGRAGYPEPPRDPAAPEPQPVPAVNRERPGFPYYRTSRLRADVFAILFPRPFEGEILRRPEFNAPRYPFRPCRSDPFRGPGRGGGGNRAICALPE